MKNIFFFVLLFHSILIPQQLKVFIPSKDTLEREQQYTFNLNVENFDSVGSFQYKIGFSNSNLELVELPTGRFNNRNISTNTLTNANANGELIILWLSNGIDPLNYGSALLMDLKFNIKLNAAAGPDTLKFNQCLVSNMAGNSLNPIFYGSTFIIQKLVNIDGDTFTNLNYHLYQNYPNPFNPSTIIRYKLPSEGYVMLKLYNSLGEELHTFVTSFQRAGEYEIPFNAVHLPSGIYFYKLSVNKRTEIKKMLLLK